MTSDVSKSLTATILDKNISKIESTVNSLSIDYADITISAVLGDAVLSELPIIKTLHTVSKTWSSVTTYLLTQKILIFLFELGGVSLKEREKFISQLDSRKRDEIINQLLIVLDKHDRFIKSAIQGRLFKAMIQGHLSQDNYLSITHSVNQIDAELFKALEVFYASDSGAGNLSTDVIYSLASLRLVGIDNSQIGLIGGGGPMYKKNRLGIMLVTIGLGVKTPFDFVETVIGSEEAKTLYKSIGFHKM